jgi:hypothetical protein
MSQILDKAVLLNNKMCLLGRASLVIVGCGASRTMYRNQYYHSGVGLGKTLMGNYGKLREEVS